MNLTAGVFNDTLRIKFACTAPGAVQFDGIDDYVEVTQNSGLPLYAHEAYSVAMWVKGVPQADIRVSSEGNRARRFLLFNIGIDPSGLTGRVHMFTRYRSDSTLSADSNNEAFDNTWHHIVWVDNNGAGMVYIDGVPDANDFTYPRETMPLDTTTIGGILRDYPSHFFSGAIDDVRVYDHALSAEEVREIYCHEEGDTRCDALSVEGPAGQYTLHVHSICFGQ